MGGGYNFIKLTEWYIFLNYGSGCMLPSGFSVSPCIYYLYIYIYWVYVYIYITWTHFRIIWFYTCSVYLSMFVCMCSHYCFVLYHTDFYVCSVCLYVCTLCIYEHNAFFKKNLPYTSQPYVLLASIIYTKLSFFSKYLLLT